MINTGGGGFSGSSGVGGNDSSKLGGIKFGAVTYNAKPTGTITSDQIVKGLLVAGAVVGGLLLVGKVRGR